MDVRDTASAAIQRSSQYEELVRRQLNYSADSSISNSLSLPPYDETDTVSNDSEVNVADDCSTSSSGGARKQDIREVQDYLERLDQKRGILERHASAELVRPAAMQADSLRRTGSASLPIPAKVNDSSRQRLQQTQPDEAGSSSAKPRPGADQPSLSQPPQQQASTSHPPPVLKAPLTTPRAAASGGGGGAGQHLREATGVGGALTSSGTYEVMQSSSTAAAAYRPVVPVRLAATVHGVPSPAAGPVGLEAAYSGSDGATMPQLPPATEVPASSPSLTVSDLSAAAAAAAGDGSAAAVAAVLKMRLAAREDEVQRLSAQVHLLREAGRGGQQNGGHALAMQADAGGVADTSDRRLAALLREKAELERRCDDLLREKENLTTELRKLREQLDSLSAAATGAAAASSQAAAGPQPMTSADPGDARAAALPLATVDERLLSYRPDNPNALQRKIDDLECQIQDLVEANETACDEVQRLESENQQLCEEIGSLKASHEMALLDLEAECRRLQDKLAQLQKKSMTADDLHLHSEIQQLQIDLRATQEKNRVLNEENMGLRNAMNESVRPRLSINDLASKMPVGHRASDDCTALPSFVDDIMAEDGGGGSSLAALHRLQRAAADVTAAAGADSRPARPMSDLPPPLPSKKLGGSGGGAAVVHAADSWTNGSSEIRRRSDGAGAGPGAFASVMSAYASADPTKGKDESKRSLAVAGAAPPAGTVGQRRPSSPAGRSDLSDSTAVLLASYEPSFSRRKATAGHGTASQALANGHGESKLEQAAPADVRAPGCRTSLPAYVDDDGGGSDTTADILQDIATYLQGRKGDLESSMKASFVRTDGGRHRPYDPTAIGCHSEESSVSSSSISSLDEQPLEAEDFGALQHAGAHSPRQSGGAGLRTLTSPVQPTQHNRHSFDSSSSTLSVTGRRPFAPRTPADLRLGDIIKYTRPDCRIARGVVKFIGHLHNKNDTFIGIETEYNDGKHDGVYDGSRYFQCKPNRGAFIPFTKVIMVWGS